MLHGIKFRKAFVWVTVSEASDEKDIENKLRCTHTNGERSGKDHNCLSYYCHVKKEHHGMPINI